MLRAGKQQSKAAAKNAKRKEKRAEEAAAARKPEVGPAPAAESVREALAGISLEAQDATAATPLASRIRALKKKLRQVEELAAAQASGKQLQPEQLQKLERIPAL